MTQWSLNCQIRWHLLSAQLHVKRKFQLCCVHLKSICIEKLQAAFNTPAIMSSNLNYDATVHQCDLNCENCRKISSHHSKISYETFRSAELISRLDLRKPLWIAQERRRNQMQWHWVFSFSLRSRHNSLLFYMAVKWVRRLLRSAARAKILPIADKVEIESSKI